MKTKAEMRLGDMVESLCSRQATTQTGNLAPKPKPYKLAIDNHGGYRIMTRHPLINNKINNMMHSISATYIKPFIKPLANLICVTLLFISPTRHCERSEAIQTLLEKSKKQACNRKGHHRRIYQLKLVIHARNPHGYWSASRLLFNLNTHKIQLNDAEWRVVA